MTENASSNEETTERSETAEKSELKTNQDEENAKRMARKKKYKNQIDSKIFSSSLDPHDKPLTWWTKQPVKYAWVLKKNSIPFFINHVFRLVKSCQKFRCRLAVRAFTLCPTSKHDSLSRGSLHSRSRRPLERIPSSGYISKVESIPKIMIEKR